MGLLPSLAKVKSLSAPFIISLKSLTGISPLSRADSKQDKIFARKKYRQPRDSV